MSLALRPIAIILLVLVLVGGFFYVLSRNKTVINNVLPGLTKDDATVSGEIDFNGVAPEGSTFTVSARESGKGDFKPVAKDLAPSDLVDWSWHDALTGKNYDIRAELIQDGKVLATSQTLMITAPASNEALVMNYPTTQTDPPSAQASPVATPAPQPSKITGSINLNGYIPPGATITLEQRQVGDTQYQQIGTPFTAQDSENWVWKEPVTGTQYNLQAVLVSNGVTIGQSQVLTATAPASNEVLIINSNAKPPAQGSTSASPQPQAGSISGSINFNGVTPQNSSIVILARPNGSGNYQVAVSGVQAANGSQWLWNSAQSGTTYEMVAVLKQQNSNGTQSDIATSQSLIASSPAQNEVFTLNSNISLPAPQGTVTITCQTKNSSNNTWSTQFNFPSQTSANGYWFQVGTTNGGSDLVNSTQNAQGSQTQVVNATVNDSVIYYARYAYTYTPNPNSGSGFSSFSGSFQLKCPQ